MRRHLACLLLGHRWGPRAAGVRYACTRPGCRGWIIRWP